VIVVAGMEGALATLVTALVACPVIALPTSVGYGASLGGLAALLAMLSSCNPGMAVVNVDNGVGAAAAAWRVVQPLARRPAGSVALKPAVLASPSRPEWRAAD
jgi:NCAIR mutase (PurE)-related protein